MVIQCKEMTEVCETLSAHDDEEFAEKRVLFHNLQRCLLRTEEQFLKIAQQ